MEEKEIQEVETVETVETTETVEAAIEEKPAKGKRANNAKAKGKRKIETVENAPQSEWKERVVQIRRVTKVVKGGKKLSFRAIVIVGNGKGQVGVGCAKASEVIIAIQKAIAEGRKNLISVPIFKTTIPHPIVGRSGAGSVMLRPASQGTGVIAGGPARAVLELAGIRDIRTKCLRSNNPKNVVAATIEGLASLKSVAEVAQLRGKKPEEILG